MRQRGVHGRAPAGHQPPAEAPAARAHSASQVQRRDAERARDVRRRVPLLVQAGRRDQHDARHLARIRVRVQAGHHAAQGQTAQNQRRRPFDTDVILSIYSGFRREPLFWIDRIDRRRGAVQPPRRGPPDAPQHRAEAVRESQRVVIRELGEQGRAPVPREVQQEHVVAVAVAKLRGGVQPARVAHQPAVQEHDARAHAASRGVRRARDLPPREQLPEPEVTVAPGRRGRIGDVDRDLIGGARTHRTARSSAAPPLRRSASRAHHCGLTRDERTTSFVSAPERASSTLALGAPRVNPRQEFKFREKRLSENLSKRLCATANDLTRAPPRRGPSVASAPQSASHAPHARRRSNPFAALPADTRAAEAGGRCLIIALTFGSSCQHARTRQGIRRREIGARPSARHDGPATPRAA